MLPIPSAAGKPATPLERTLYVINSALVCWFFTFLVTGPKSSYATTALLALSLLTLPATARTAPKVWDKAAPWLLGLGIYCIYQIIYRLIDGGFEARIDPPARYLGAIPILFYLARYGFCIHALWAGLALGCLIGGVAGAQEVLIEGAERASAGHHPIAYGSILTLMSMGSLYSATITRAATWRTLLSIGFIIGLAGALLSGTRGLYPALAICVFFIGHRKLQEQGIKKIKIFIPLTLISTAIALIATQVPSIQKRFQETLWEYDRISQGNLESSFGNRLQMWDAGLFIISKNPIFGLGPDISKRPTFAAAFMQEKKHDIVVLTRYDHLHNLYINEAATFGLIGLMALGTLFYGALRKTSGPSYDMIALALIIILLEGLTETILNHHRFMMAFVILVTLIRSRPFTEPPLAPSSLLSARPA